MWFGARCLLALSLELGSVECLMAPLIRYTPFQ